MNEFKLFWKRGFDFKGVSTRKEFWIPNLINFIIGIILAVISMVVFNMDLDGFSLVDVYAIISLVPNLAIDIRRLHDIGKSGWFLLIALIPLVGGIIVLVWFCMDSVHGYTEWKANDIAAGYSVKYPVEEAAPIDYVIE